MQKFSPNFDLYSTTIWEQSLWERTLWYLVLAFRIGVHARILKEAIADEQFVKTYGT